KADKQESEPEGDPHLRSSKEVTGYSIQGKNDAIGHVEDFIVDDKTWIVRYMVVDTGRKIFGGRKVLIAPHWIDKVDWAESKVFVALSTQSIKESPEYDSSAILNRDYEEILYEHYGLPKYWI
ncbi:MAG: PRC-barrel domain-containing protein, partial [Methanococcaceae archaeon]